MRKRILAWPFLVLFPVSLIGVAVATFVVALPLFHLLTWLGLGTGPLWIGVGPGLKCPAGYRATHVPSRDDMVCVKERQP